MQGANQRGTLVFRPGAQQLQHREIAEAVNGHARQPVGLSGNQTIAVQPVTLCQPLAPLLRLLQTTDKEVYIDGFFFIERPDARADLRCWRVCAALTISLMVNNIDGFTEAGFTFHASNRAGKNRG